MEPIMAPVGLSFHTNAAPPSYRLQRRQPLLLQEPPLVKLVQQLLHLGLLGPRQVLGGALLTAVGEWVALASSSIDASPHMDMDSRMEWIRIHHSTHAPPAPPPRPRSRRTPGASFAPAHHAAVFASPCGGAHRLQTWCSPRCMSRPTGAPAGPAPPRRLA